MRDAFSRIHPLFGKTIIPAAVPLCFLLLFVGSCFSQVPNCVADGLKGENPAPIDFSRWAGRRSKAQMNYSSPFSMERAVRHAVSYNPSLEAYEAQARSSSEGRNASISAFGPKLSTSYGYAKQERISSSKGLSKVPERGTYTWSIDISQNVFNGFATLADYQRKALQLESDKASLRGKELEITVSVQSSFVSYLCAIENLASCKEAVARLRDQIKITSALHDAGIVPKLDVLQAQTDLASAEQSLLSAEKTLESSKAKLNTLLGFGVEDPVDYRGSLSVPGFSESLESCLARAYRLRPDIYVAFKAVEIAVKDRLVARSGYYPSVEAYYGVTKSGNTLDLERAGTNSSKSTVWEVGAQLNWDVFQWGVTYFADKEAGWLVSKKRAEARQAMLSAGYEVKDYYLSLREAKKRVRVAELTLEHAKETYRSAFAMYREQTGTNYEVLDASSKVLSAASDLTAAKGDYLTALSKLYASIGEYHPGL